MVRKPGGKNRKRYHNRDYIRKNDRIRAREVRVIGPDGKMLGVMNPAEAYQMAKKVGLDLVEVSPTAKPPVCRILDFGKYKYELSKKNDYGDCKLLNVVHFKSFPAIYGNKQRSKVLHLAALLGNAF